MPDRLRLLLVLLLCAVLVSAAVLVHGRRAPDHPCPVPWPFPPVQSLDAALAAREIGASALADSVGNCAAARLGRAHSVHRRQAPRRVPTELEPLDDGEVTPESRGVGRASLRLRLHDAHSGLPVASRIRLWRLFVPADETWGPGDHIQATLSVDASAGATLTGLPAGWYRAEADAADLTEPDPPPFLVEGDAEIDAPVNLPRAFPLHVRIVDLHGRPVKEVAIESFGQSQMSSDWELPRWVRRRERLDHRRHPPCVYGGGVGCSLSGPTHRSSAQDGVHEVGQLWRDCTCLRSTARWRVEIEGHSGVWIAVHGEDAGRGTWVGLAVPLTDLIAGFTMADGRNVLDAGARVSALGRAVLPADGESAEPWRDVEVEIRVWLAGHKRLDDSWRPGESYPTWTFARVGD